MKITPEQQAVCESKAEVLKIKAGAGTGKTTTLKALAFANPNLRILYMAFNRSIKEEASNKFPKNVASKTAHGIAFAEIGTHYANAGKLSMDIKPFQIRHLIEKSLMDIPSGLHNLYGARVIEAIKNFTISDDEGLWIGNVSIGQSPGEKKHFNEDNILFDAITVWQSMIDYKTKTPITHDTYLKLYQLEDWDLGYDLILLDEAQDTNPVTQAIVERQPCRIAYVGDEHQAIYGFRGARNAMAEIHANEEHFLTGSFRFGRGIANVANQILEVKGEADLKIRGLGKDSELRLISNRYEKPYTYIARGNSALFRKAVSLMKMNKRFAFVGDLSYYRFDLIEQTYFLFKGMKSLVTDPFLRSFESFESLEEYAHALGERDIIGRVNLIQKYQDETPSILDNIEDKALIWNDPEEKVILTTAHRSKGLEFESVKISEDFMSFFDEEKNEWRDFSNADSQTIEEINLQYVACTRSMKTLDVGEQLNEYIEHYEKKRAKLLTKAGRPRELKKLVFEPQIRKTKSQPKRKIPRSYENSSLNGKPSIGS